MVVNSPPLSPPASAIFRSSCCNCSLIPNVPESFRRTQSSPVPSSPVKENKRQPRHANAEAFPTQPQRRNLVLSFRSPKLACSCAAIHSRCRHDARAEGKKDKQKRENQQNLPAVTRTPPVPHTPFPQNPVPECRHRGDRSAASTAQTHHLPPGPADRLCEKIFPTRSFLPFSEREAHGENEHTSFARDVSRPTVRPLALLVRAGGAVFLPAGQRGGRGDGQDAAVQVLGRRGSIGCGGF